MASRNPRLLRQTRSSNAHGQFRDIPAVSHPQAHDVPEQRNPASARAPPVRAQGMPTPRNVVHGESVSTRDDPIVTRGLQCGIGAKCADFVPQAKQGLDQGDQQRGSFHLARKVASISLQQMFDVRCAQRPGDSYAHVFDSVKSIHGNTSDEGIQSARIHCPSVDARKSRYARASPSRMTVEAFHPIEFSRPTSINLRGVPSGLVASNSSAPW